MRHHLCALSRVDVLALIGIAIIVTGLLLPIFSNTGHRHRSSGCARQIGWIGKGMSAYANTNGDYWAYQEDLRGAFPLNGDPGDGRPARSNPCVSLSLLYPRWIDDVDNFRCGAKGEGCPIIIEETIRSCRYTWFGKIDSTRVGNRNPFGTLTGLYPLVPHVADGQRYHSANAERCTEHSGDGKDLYLDYCTPIEHERAGFANTSYGYDDLAAPRDMKPGHARAADMCYEAAGNDAPWVERTNHEQRAWSVLYWDGHVSFADTVYASDDPEDNIFIPNSDAPGTDAVIARTHADALKPSAVSGSDAAWTPWKDAND